MARPYDIFLDTEITQYLIDQKFLLNKNTNKKEEVFWSQGGLLCVGNNWYNGKDLLETFTLLDGSPCCIDDEEYIEWESDRWVKKPKENKNNIMDIFNIFGK